MASQLWASSQGCCRGQSQDGVREPCEISLASPPPLFAPLRFFECDTLHHVPAVAPSFRSLRLSPIPPELRGASRFVLAGVHHPGCERRSASMLGALASDRAADWNPNLERVQDWAFWNNGPSKYAPEKHRRVVSLSFHHNRATIEAESSRTRTQPKSGLRSC